MKKHEGLRFNQGKLRFDLVNPYAHEQMVKILTKGSQKYEERNWEKGMAWSNVIASLKRHLHCIEKGEDYDIESGELHAAHLACNAHFLTAYYKLYPQGDDRPHTYLKQHKIGLDIDEVLADWVKYYCEYFNVQIPQFWNFDKDIKINYNKLLSDPYFWENIPKKIEPFELPFEPTCYITSRGIPTEWTEQWLEKNGFPAVPVYTVAPNTSKVEIALVQELDIFVDDRYENFVELNKAGVCTFLMDAPHNQRYDVGFKRIFELKDIVR